MDADVQCSYCGKEKEGLRKCPCLLVAYCDSQCQMSHWGVHKVLCDAAGKAKREAAVTPPPTPPQVPPQHDLKVLQDAMERVATVNPKAAASILIGLVKSNPSVLYPATAALTKMVSLQTEADRYAQQQQLQMQYLVQRSQHSPQKEYPARARKQQWGAPDWNRPGSYGGTPDRHSTVTRESSPLKSSLDLDHDDSLASSIASAILDES